MIERNEKPITLDRPGVAVEERGVLSNEVLAIVRALHARLEAFNRNLPTPQPRGIAFAHAAPETPSKKEVMLKVELRGNENDPLFTSWREAMEQKAGNAAFGEKETDGTVTFPKPETVNFRWGNSNLLVEPRGMNYLALTPETILAIDTVQGVESETGRWAKAVCESLEARGSETPTHAKNTPHRAVPQPDGALNQVSM